MARLRPIAHEDQLSIVEHLDELRSRLIVCFAVLFVAFGVCFWQNTALINALNRALPPTTTAAKNGGLAAQNSQSAQLQKAFAQIEHYANSLAVAPGLSQAARLDALGIASGAGKAAHHLPKSAPEQVKPVTLGVGESFTTTLTVVGYFALLFSLPVLLYQLYAFVLPGLKAGERRIATPTMIAAPTLFVTGAVFAYFFILPPAVHFLQGYNSDQFQILVQAKTYYKFEMLTMMGVGLAFQVPLVLLALQALGVITSRTLTKNWRYAIVIIAVIAAALPGVDPVTTFFEAMPLVILYLASIVLLKIVDRRDAKRAAAEFQQAGERINTT